MPHLPPDQRSPHDAAATPKRSEEPAESPHRRQGDRASGDDSATKQSKADKLKAKLAPRRNELVRSGLPIFYRFSDLIAVGLITNRSTLLRLIDNEGFPAGTMMSRNTRVWRLDDVEAWLASRPSARKITPPGARHPRVRAKRGAAAEA